MKIEFTSGTEAKAVIAFVGQADGQAAMSPPAQKLDRACKSRLSKAVAAAKFNGGAGKVLTVHAPSDSLDVVVLVGVGDLAKVDGAVLERAAASGAKALLTSGIETASVALAGWKKVATGAHAARIGFGAALAAYRFDTYRTQLKAEQKPSLKTLEIDVPEGGDVWAAHQAVVDGVSFARDLVNEVRADKQLRLTIGELSHRVRFPDLFEQTLTHARDLFGDFRAGS
jgi:leucyl aminopeptidase